MVYSPIAYEEAKYRRIAQNAAITRRRKLEAAIANDSDDFKSFLLGGAPKHIIDSNVHGEDYDKAMKEWRKTVGHLPEFLREALYEWGGLSEKQLAYARKVFAENTAKGSAMAQEEIERRTKAPAWVAGRQHVSGVIGATRIDGSDFGPKLKALVKLDDGRLLWTSMPGSMYCSDHAQYRGRKISMTVTVTPRDDDPTFGFGKRPAKVETDTA